MKKSLCIFLFCTPLWLTTYSQIEGCSKQAPKISFSGKAPWVIDGKIKDWETILGPYTGDNNLPFFPPPTSAFNWANDKNLLFGGRDLDLDTPEPQNDLRFLAFTHDDYNVYFYMRRKLNGSAPSTCNYFFDVNGDAVMNLGEPVIHASFTDKSISPLTLGLFIPDRDTDYSEQKKGNIMTRSRFEGVDGYPMPGDVLDIFNSELLLFPPLKLKKNEIFRAKLTEEGYGLELAIPWRYLRNWLMLKHPLNPGDIFFYKVSMQEGGGHYRPEKVEDNAGSCLGGVGISGNVNLDKSVTTTTLVPGSAYRFKVTYTNLTNAATKIGLEYMDFNFTADTGATVTPNDFNVTVYADNNCNGTVDAGDTAVNYAGLNTTLGPCCKFTFKLPGNTPGVSVVAPPFGKGCFIVDLTLPPNRAVTKLKISLWFSELFVEGKEPELPPCPPPPAPCTGSKPINAVGLVEAELDIDSDELITEAQTGSIAHEAPGNPDVVLYPNPSRGITNLVLPQSADISIVDNMGRSIRTINKAKAGVVQMKDLKAGLYIIKVKVLKTGKVITKKLIIQP